jgi:response regulator RpfG family c-di-GMP phosphodiesterase
MTTKQILLVDDEEDILFFYTECLKSNNYQIVSFDNPLEALNYLEMYENISRCSLVISDYKMPQMSGIDFIKKIKEKYFAYKIKTMLISAYLKTDLLRDNPYLEKIDKIIEKPVTLETLKNEVLELIK